MVAGSRVVYAYNAFYQGREELGPTSSWEVTWGNSLQRFFGPDLIRFNPDAYGYESHAQSDAALLELCRLHDVQLLVMISHKGFQWTREFISPPTLKALRDGGVRVISIWGDIQSLSERRALRALRPNVDLNICTASHGAAMRLAKSDPVLYSWVPISDERASRICDCGAYVSLAGSLKLNRQRTVDFLRARGIAVHAAGGEGAGALSREDYLTILAHPMTLGFANTGLEAVTNARTFEALRQGSVLLEAWGRETAKIFRPYEDYVPWHSHEDLARKISSLIERPDELARIGANGLASSSAVTAEALWTRALARLGFAAADTGLEFVHPVDWQAYRGPHRRIEMGAEKIMSSPSFEPTVSLVQRAKLRKTWAMNVARHRAKKVLARV